MRVLGIDPGSRKIGLALIETKGRQLLPVAYQTKRLDLETDFANRLLAAYSLVCDWIDRYKPDVVAMEQAFVSKNARSALLLGQARGALLVAIAQKDIPIVDYPPAKVKKALVGHGRAGKEDIRRMTQIELKLNHLPPEDAADALAIAMAHINLTWLEQQTKVYAA